MPRGSRPTDDIHLLLPACCPASELVYCQQRRSAGIYSTAMDDVLIVAAGRGRLRARQQVTICFQIPFHTFSDI